MCVSFVIPSFGALIEQSFQSTHQNPERYVVAESTFPRLADDLDHLAEGELGDIENLPFLDVITFRVAFGRRGFTL
jgi:hypothetical protein